MTQVNLLPNQEIRNRHSALKPMMKYLFHQHCTEPQYRGTYCESLLTDLENAQKIVDLVFSKRCTTPISTYYALRNASPKWNTKPALILASDAIRIGEEMLFRVAYLCEQKSINLDTLLPIHPTLSPGKKVFSLWAPAMNMPELNGVDCRAAYLRWVKKSNIGKTLDAVRQRYSYAIKGRQTDLGITDHVCVISKKWLTPQVNKDHTKA